jgi:hypothetical protein
VAVCCSCASASCLSRSRIRASSSLDLRVTESLDSALDFAGFGPRRIGLPLQLMKWGVDRLGECTRVSKRSRRRTKES